jgi:hypothetical protein
MTTTLCWRSGKFVYPRSANILMHYMPLQDFSLETAQNHSLVVALRMARVENKNEFLQSYEIAAWRHTLLSQVTAQTISALASPRGRIIDFGSVNGINFEELKHARQRTDIGPAYEIILTCPRARQVFQGMHEQPDGAYLMGEYHPTSSLDKEDTLVVNQAAAIRHAAEVVPDVNQLTHDFGGHCVCALRATAERNGGMRTTVLGREVFIPSFHEILSNMRQSGQPWFYRWVPGHDRGFFLPEREVKEVGYLLAYRAEGIRLANFCSV